VANQEQGLASGILQTSFQLGGAIVLAIVTAIVDAGGANRAITTHALTAYRPALDVITGVAAFGVVIALSGLFPRPARNAAEVAADGDAASLEADDCAPVR
jgi:hypothetical protein